jgi:UDP-glucose:(heptosyl)LPS alpha-1,3-glucosyltransferase
MAQVGDIVRRPEAPLSATPGARLRIAVLNRVFAPTGGGAERYSIALVEQLAARHEIHVYAQTIAHQWPGVTYHPVSAPLRRPRWLNQLWFATATWWVTRRGFDVVHSHENTWHGNVQTLHVKTIKRSLLGGQKGIGWLTSRLKLAFSPRLLTYLALERARMRAGRGGAVVAASQTLADELQGEYPGAMGRVRVITPGVHVPSKFATKKEARHAISTGASGRIVLFVANDYLRKGLDALLQALQGFPSEVRLLVVGNTAQKDFYRKQAHALGIEQRVEFLGSLQDMHWAYFCADVLAHPTLEDSFGMVVLEAMAHGLPVVVSSASFCGASALLQNQQQALLLEDPHRADDLRNALHRVLHENELGELLVANGLALAHKHSWQQAALAYERLYQELASPSVRRRNA